VGCFGMRHYVFPALYGVRRVLLRFRSFFGLPIFSTFIFLILLGLSLTSSCITSICCGVSSVSVPSMIISLLLLSLPIFSVRCSRFFFQEPSSASMIPLPLCSYYIMYSVLQHGGSPLLHLTVLLLLACGCTLCIAGYLEQFWIVGWWGLHPLHKRLPRDMSHPFVGA